MRGYLLDDNHVAGLFREEATILRKIRSIPVDWQMRVCNVTIGELEAGHRMTQTTDQSRRDAFEKFIVKNILHLGLEVSVHTRDKYAEIMGRIWKKHPPSDGKKKTERHLLDLGVDINDVWAVAVACEHGLTFVTTDKMACIREAVGDDVHFDNWLEQPQPEPSQLIKWLKS